MLTRRLKRNRARTRGTKERELSIMDPFSCDSGILRVLAADKKLENFNVTLSGFAKFPSDHKI